MNDDRETCSRIPRMAGAAAVCLAAWVAPVHAQTNEKAPDELTDVRIEPHMNAAVPMDLPFTDESGQTVTLRKYFDGKHPVIITFNYYRCQMLCTLQLNRLVETLKEMSWTPGDQFQIVTISIDPRETAPLARAKKQNYMKEYGRPAAMGGWHFLTGRNDAIERVTDTMGFYYRYDENTDQYAHAAGLFVCTPDGRLARCIGGIDYDPQTLRLTLAESSEGKIGSTLDGILLWCFHYDGASGRYGPAAMRIMQAGGVLVVVVLSIVLLIFWRRDRRRTAAALAAAHTGGDVNT